MANVVSGRISRIVSCCTDEDGNHFLEVEYCSAGKSGGKGSEVVCHGTIHNK
jgi:hypothetical protein